MASESFEDVKKCEAHDENYMIKLENVQKYIDLADSLKETWEKKSAHNIEEQAYLLKIGKEIASMKEGSVALINQITTVSKMRIFDPRNLKGVLSGISLSAESMDKINEKVKKLYVFE